MSQTWSEFKTAVKALLTVDKNRQGLSTVLDEWIKHAVIDLQESIDYYRQGDSVIYSRDGHVRDSEAVSDNGYASVGALEAGVGIQDAYIITGTEDFDCPLNVEECYDENCRLLRMPVTNFDWGNRYDLISGIPKLAGYGLMAINRQANKFCIYPQIGDDKLVEIYYDRVRHDFTNGEVVVFDKDVEEAVGLFVKANIKREVDNDLALYNSYLSDQRPGANSYVNKKKMLFIKAAEKTQIRATAGSRYPSRSGSSVECPEDTSVEVLE